MSMKAIRKAQQTTVEEIATRAATGVARALAARQAAGIELSSEELSHVNGGFTFQDIPCPDPFPPDITIMGYYPLPEEDPFLNGS